MSGADNWIRFAGETYLVNPGERALDAMLRRGAPVNFSCRKGTCRSCLLQAVAGDPGAEARAHLPADMQALGFFLPCCATNLNQVDAVLPDLALCTHAASVAETRMLSPDILLLRLELANLIDWRAGQVVGLVAPDGAVRSYSIVSSPQDYTLDLHIRLYPGGKVSGWIKTLSVGDMVQFQGPGGAFFYEDELTDRPLFLVGSGSAGGVLAAIAREAVRGGHRGGIHLYHGARDANGLYLSPLIDDLRQAGVSVVQSASRETFGAQPARRISDVFFDDQRDLRDATLYLCGHPDLVETLRIGAVARGIDLAQIKVDAFDPPSPYLPQDRAKMRALAPDPALWAALGEGRKLMEILQDFYTRLYADARLAPFFHRVTKDRAIEKQFSFLQDLLNGSRMFFGEKPFNAHHWMVISDELFDYREAMFFDTVRAHGLPDHLTRGWAALHETFRREIVKSAPRGVMRHGVEVNLEGFTDETLGVGTLCDGCQSALSSGDAVRMHQRTGEIFCLDCAGKRAQNAAA